MRWIPVLFLLGSFCAAQTRFSPFSVGSDQLGESVAEWKANNPTLASCSKNPTYRSRGPDRDLLTCGPRIDQSGLPLTFAGATLRTETAWFYKGNLFKVEMTLLDKAELADVMAALRASLGNHIDRERSPIRDGFGFRFEQQRWIWRNKVSTAEFTSSTTPDDSPRITFTLNSTNKSLTEAQQAQATLRHL